MKPHSIFAIFYAICIICGQSGRSLADEPKKIVFISGKPSHGPMAHEHRAGNMLLAKRLNDSGLPVEAVVLPENGYPADPSVLEDAATIVVFCTGHQGHLLNPHLEEFDALMKKGTGVVMIHWATEAQIGMPAKKFLEWMGGYCDLDWSVNPHWKPNFKNFPDHPIANGVEPFSVDDEWYYHMRFVGDLKGVTPILSDLPGPETLKRPDGSRSGNPDVRRAVAAGESQHVGWAYERPDGKGRGFGFTGAHNHVSWQNDGFRKVMLNAILWTAHVEVPENGVTSAAPDEQELKANLDDKSKRKKKKAAAPPAKKPATPPASVPPAKPENRAAAAVDFQKLRAQLLRTVDSQISLALLSRTLATTEDSQVQKALLLGMLSGLEGRRNVTAPADWKSASAKLAKGSDAEVKQLAQRLSQIFGDEAATEKAIATVRDGAAPIEERRHALKSLVTQQAPELKSILEKLLDEPALRVDAIRAYSSFADPRAPKLLLNQYTSMEDQAQQAIIETLATRKEYAISLLAALKEERVPKSDVPAYIARSLSALLGDAFTAVYGDLDELSKDKAELITRYQKLLTSEKLAQADPGKGRAVFQMACAACHHLYGEGGVIGPDLTGSNRADLNYILLNMIDPSADIPDAYKLVTMTTKGGQILSGTLAEEDDQRVVLNMIGQKLTVVKSNIASRDVAPVSMMPEGLLPSLNDAQVLDLVKYLQTTTQVGLPQ